MKTRATSLWVIGLGLLLLGGVLGFRWWTTASRPSGASSDHGLEATQTASPAPGTAPGKARASVSSPETFAPRKSERSPSSTDPKHSPQIQSPPPGPVTGAVVIVPEPPGTLEGRNKLLEGLLDQDMNVRFRALVSLEAHLKITPEDQVIARAIEQRALSDEADNIREQAFGVLFESPDAKLFAAALDVIGLETDPDVVQMEIRQLESLRTSAYLANLLEYQMTTEKAKTLAEQRVGAVITVLQQLASRSASADISSAAQKAVQVIQSGK